MSSIYAAAVSITLYRILRDAGGLAKQKCPSKQIDRFKYFSADKLDFMKQRVRKESGLQKLEPESYREYQQRHTVIFIL